MPEEVKTHLEDFEVANTLLNGTENNYFYNLNGLSQYVQMVDMFTPDSVRYQQKTFTYDNAFKIVSIVHEYAYGKKRRTDVFTYGTGPTAGAITNVTTTEEDIDVTWSTPLTSTGWPNYTFNAGVVQSIGAGDNISINALDPANPIISADDAPLQSIVAGDNVTINNTDPSNPIISADDPPPPTVLPDWSTDIQAQQFTSTDTIISPYTVKQSFMGGNQSLNPGSWWQRLPGGLILQGGTLTPPDNDQWNYFAYHIPFSGTNTFSFTAVYIGSSIGEGIAHDQWSNSQFRLWGNPYNHEVSWMAIGY